MAIARKPEEDDRKGFDAHRLGMVRIGGEVNELAGIPDRLERPVEELIQELHESQRRNGVHPEDNIGSREILHMRYGDGWQEE